MNYYRHLHRTKVWLSGYLVANQQLTSGTSDTQGSQLGAVSKDTETMLQQNEPTIQPEKRAITLLYGSETGNAQGLAEIFEERLSNIGHNVTLKAMDEFKPKNLKMLKIYLLLLPHKVKEIHRIMQPNYMNLFMVEKHLN